MSKFFHAFASRLLKAKHIKGLTYFFYKSKAASEAFRLDKLGFLFENKTESCPAFNRHQKTDELFLNTPIIFQTKFRN